MAEAGAPFQRVLWVGSMLYFNPYGRGGARVRGLEALGCAVPLVDKRLIFSSLGPIASRLESRLLRGRATTALNRLVVMGARCHRPDLIWIEKGRDIWPSTVRELKAEFGVPIVHHCTDDLLFNPTNRSRHYEDALMDYTLHLTANPSNMDEIRRRGASADLILNGYDVWAGRVELTQQERARYEADVAFIGHCEPNRIEAIRALCDSGVSVKIWGNDRKWQALADCPLAHVTGESVYGPEYAKAICGARICLGFLSKMNHDEQTGRTVEVPACGGFLLIERTELQKRYFDEGVEIEFYGDHAELVEKVHHYLAHEDERARIADAALSRCRQQDYSYGRRLLDALRLVDEARERQ